VEIGQVLLDLSPDAPTPAPDRWRPRRLPGPLELVREAVEEYVRRPSTPPGTR
jgi:hypothetical protein